jgi:hypothetical protein
MDMPDTVTATEASASGSLDGEYDDAIDYYTPGEPLVDGKAPSGPIADRWQNRKFEARLVNPANRRKLSIIIVGTGLAGASAAAPASSSGGVAGQDWGAIERMEADGLLKSIPVVVVSSEGSATRMDALKAKGIKGYIRKPFSPETIKRTLFEVLGEGDGR